MEEARVREDLSEKGGNVERQEELLIPLRERFDKDACEERRKWLEAKVGTSLPNLGVWWPDSGGKVREEGLKYTIENPIGFTMIPVGIAGPLHFNGTHAKGPIFAPFATVEGSLVASMSRGARVINLSGGVRTFAGRQRMARGPLFVTNSPQAAELLAEWILKARDRMIPVIARVSQYSVLKEVHFSQDFEDLHVFLAFETGDASGQNMTTLAADAIMRWVTKTAPAEVGKDRLRILNAFVVGGFTGDKRDTTSNHLLGRGLTCFASVDIPEDTLKSKLHVTTRELLSFWRSYTRMQQRISLHGPSIHIPNAVAGFFLSTGQDAGCIRESSIGQTEFCPLPNGGVRASVRLPCLVIGTVGGATRLPTQRECLEVMGCVGTGKVKRLGEIIAGYTLCLELSLNGALAAGHFADSMIRYNRPVKKKSVL